MSEGLNITLITIDDNLHSVFSEKTLSLSARGGMNITDQLPTLSCRLRTSAADYSSDWHLAGDPTLIIIQQGCLRIHLRNNSFKDFNPGDHFVAQDKLPAGITFDSALHGHKAEVIGEKSLQAVHVKLATSL